ncbi:uncharacterized protein LOC135714965 [Ochlerotatus camptorhynchus]|uniref:uncharacterized protein LOC135714965 n=1 Tax=Ochlerotatus camptorhynchus TaxID=644619 RepID=UPI0031D819D7
MHPKIGEDFSDEQVTSSYTEDLPALFNLDEHSSDDDLDVQNECIEEYSTYEASDSELQDAENRGIAQDDVWIEADTYEDKSLSTFPRNWSLEFNISQNAMKPLMQKLSQYDRTLPNSPRRLLRTPRTKPTIINLEGGEYWHQGVGNMILYLRRNFVSINVNIDGLPIFKNGAHQVWPILFNIHGKPDVKPMIAGMFYGRNKPKKIEQFLSPFVTEIVPILQNGIHINGIKLNVNIRAMICDSPARAFVKGTVNFNSIHGCLKCCTIGQHSPLLRTNIFPQTLAKKRTDAGFRNKEYEGHYQVYKIRENGKVKRIPVTTPLLQLPIDMVEDVIVSDSLHLLHLGIMKRLLIAYKDGHNESDDRKWPKQFVASIA